MNDLRAMSDTEIIALGEQLKRKREVRTLTIGALESLKTLYVGVDKGAVRLASHVRVEFGIDRYPDTLCIGMPVELSMDVLAFLVNHLEEITHEKEDES